MFISLAIFHKFPQNFGEIESTIRIVLHCINPIKFVRMAVPRKVEIDPFSLILIFTADYPNILIFKIHAAIFVIF